MRVSVDMAMCMSSGMCTGIAPEVFELRDDGTLHLLAEDVTGELADRVRSAAECCPVEAIQLQA